MSDPESQISVVVDNHPRFFCEFILWALCAKNTLTQSKQVVFVNCRPEGLIRWAESLHFEVRLADAPIPESPHCNKLIPFLDSDRTCHRMVADTDLFFFRDIDSFMDPGYLRTPPNNHGVPALAMFEMLFKKAGIQTAPELGLSLFKGYRSRETYAGNISAGLIFIPRDLNDFASEWLETAQWLSENRVWLGNLDHHIDQISFALTVARSDWPFRFLPAQTNAVFELLPQIETLYGFHATSGHIPKFGHWFTADGELDGALVNPELEQDIAWFNEKVQEAKSLLAGWPETAGFAPNLINPAWAR